MTTSFPFARRWSMRGSFGLAAAVLGVFGFAPAVAVVVLSFTDIRGLPGIPVHWIGAANYAAFFSAAHWPDNLNALGHTVEFAVVTTVLQIVLAVGVALLLNQRLRGRNLYRAVVFLPTVLGVTVIGLIWSLVFNPDAGPGSSALSWFGGHSAFFGDPALALPLVIGVQVWSVLGLSVVIFLAGLQAIPPDLTEAAHLDGASAWKRLRHVTLPMLAPSVTTNVLLGIVNSLQSYQLVYVLTGPNNRATQVLSLQIYVQGFGGVPGSVVAQSQGYAAAISVLQFVLVAVVSLAALAYLRRREVTL